ncbi:MAG: tail fiber domain-containing protein, partial [Patescibacteria group bacterium]
GNVGIGTTTPWARLSADTSSLGAGVPSFVVGSSTRTDLVVLQSGNVGIGASSPTAKLTIQGGELQVKSEYNNQGGIARLIRYDDTPGANDMLGAIYFSDTSDNTSNVDFASIGAYVDGTVSGAGDLPSRLSFFTTQDESSTGVERLTIKNSGNVGIGTTTPWRTFSLSGTAAMPGLVNDSTGYYVCLNTTSGQMATSTTACGGSSLRFKQNINPLNYGLAEIEQLQPVSFDWRQEFMPNNTQKQVGFIAEDMAKIIPEIVGFDSEGKASNIDYGKLAPILVNAIQQQQKQIDAVKLAQDLYASSTTEFLQNSGNGANVTITGRISSKSSSTGGSDMAEMYNSTDALEPGDVVAITDTRNFVKIAQKGEPVLGIVSTEPGVILGLQPDDNSTKGIVKDVKTDGESAVDPLVVDEKTVGKYPIALVGRVPVKISLENGSIYAGDYLTLSSTTPGVATKAISSGNTIGVALEDYIIASSTDATSTILVFVRVGWQNIIENNQIVLGSEIGIGETVNPNTLATTSMTLVSGGMLVNQIADGNILQLQSNDQDKFLVATSGSVRILAEATSDTEDLFVVSNASSTVLVINARGDVKTKGTIVFESDSAAGSIATDATTGLAEVNFGYHLGKGKPVIQLTPEGDIPAIAQVTSWKKDSTGNYTGFFIKTFGLSGQSVSANVHYAVFGKQDGYTTSGNALPVLTNVSSDPVVAEPTSSTTPEVIPADTASSTPTVIEEPVATSTPEIIPAPEPVVAPVPEPVLEPVATAPVEISTQ